MEKAIKKWTLEEVASAIGEPYSQVRRAMGRDHGTMSEERAESIRERVEALGYIKPGTPEFKALQDEIRRMDYLKYRNFPTKAHETRRMEELRKQGYSNAEIARMVGRCVNTVANRIGRQGKEYTDVSHKMQGKEHRIKAQARRERVYQAELERIRQEENEIAEKRRMMEAMQEQARKMLEACASMESEIAGKVIELNGAKAELRRKAV